MWETARAKLRDWYIFIVGLCLIAGGFFSRFAPMHTSGGCRRANATR